MLFYLTQSESHELAHFFASVSNGAGDYALFVRSFVMTPTRETNFNQLCKKTTRQVESVAPRATVVATVPTANVYESWLADAHSYLFSLTMAAPTRGAHDTSVYLASMRSPPSTLLTNFDMNAARTLYYALASSNKTLRYLLLRFLCAHNVSVENFPEPVLPTSYESNELVADSYYRDMLAIADVLVPVVHPLFPRLSTQLSSTPRHVAIKNRAWTVRYSTVIERSIEGPDFLLFFSSDNNGSIIRIDSFVPLLPLDSQVSVVGAGRENNPPSIKLASFTNALTYSLRTVFTHKLSYSIQGASFLGRSAVQVRDASCRVFNPTFEQLPSTVRVKARAQPETENVQALFGVWERVEYQVEHFERFVVRSTSPQYGSTEKLIVTRRIIIPAMWWRVVQSKRGAEKEEFVRWTDLLFVCGLLVANGAPMRHDWQKMSGLNLGSMWLTFCNFFAHNRVPHPADFATMSTQELLARANYRISCSMDATEIPRLLDRGITDLLLVKTRYSISRYEVELFGLLVRKMGLNVYVQHYRGAQAHDGVDVFVVCVETKDFCLLRNGGFVQDSLIITDLDAEFYDRNTHMVSYVDGPHTMVTKDLLETLNRDLERKHIFRSKPGKFGAIWVRLDREATSELILTVKLGALDGLEEMRLDLYLSN